MPANSKRVFAWVFRFSTGRDGCYLTAKELAECMGLDEDTVEEHWRYLQGLGLLTRTGRGLRPTLPPDCVPSQDHRLDAVRCAGVLEPRLRARVTPAAVRPAGSRLA